MSALLGTLLDPERLATCREQTVREAREDARRVPPYWMFAPRTPVQERIRHPLHHRPTERRRDGPRHSRFGALP